jgi:hypothetical protein
MTGRDVFELIELITTRLKPPRASPFSWKPSAGRPEPPTEFSLFMCRDEGIFRSVASYGWTEELVQLYGKRYAHIDPWLLAGDRFPGGYVGKNSALCSDGEFYGSEAYRDFYAPNNCYHGCGALIQRSQDGMSFLTQVRPREAGPYGVAELSICAG